MNSNESRISINRSVIILISYTLIACVAVLETGAKKENADRIQRKPGGTGSLTTIILTIKIWIMWDCRRVEFRKVNCCSVWPHKH